MSSSVASMVTGNISPADESPVLGNAVKLPPLQNGDQLTRDEFERRYAAMPDVKQAELI